MADRPSSDHPPSDLAPPTHDPIADEQDLLTIQEAAARLHEQLAEARTLLADAVSSRASPADRDALRHRVDVLEAGVSRYDALRRARRGADAR